MITTNEIPPDGYVLAHLDGEGDRYRKGVRFPAEGEAEDVEYPSGVYTNYAWTVGFATQQQNNKDNQAAWKKAKRAAKKAAANAAMEI